MASSNAWQYGNWNTLTSGQENQPVSTLQGSTPSYYSAEYGGIAQTADPTASAAAAIAGNQANSGALSNLANYWNQFNTQQLINEQNAVNPYWSQSMSQAGENAYSELQGIIPQDVINAIGQQAAERGISTGLGGGAQNTSAALLRALGLESLDLTNLGLSNLGTVEKLTPTASLFDTSPYMTTASDFQAAQQAANKSAAAAIPYVVAQSNLSAAKTGTTAGTTAAGSTPKVSGSGGASSTPWWSTATSPSSGYNYFGSSGAGTTRSGVSDQGYNDWWNSYGPGAYSNQQASQPGQESLSTSQEDQLRAEGWTQSEIDSLLAYSSPDEISSLFSDASSGYQDVAASPE